MSIYFRIPGWCRKASLKINGKLVGETLNGGQYKAIQRNWKKSDKVELFMEMPGVLIESNPLVEETRNRVAVKKGPIVYCLESTDLSNQNVFDIVIPATAKFQSTTMQIDKGNVMALTTDAELIQNNSWKNTLYRELNTSIKPIKIKLIPYYAWANRGKSDMTVWLPLAR
jgi:DUF1680 family protein